MEWARLPIGVLIIDDHEGMRRALAEVVASDPELEVVGQAADPSEGIRRARELSPDVALVDVRMPGGGGPAAARGMLKLGRPPRVLALSASDSREAIMGMIRAGAVGYLVKGSSPDEIRAAIHRAPQGRSTLSPAAASGLIGAVAQEARGSDQRWVVRADLERHVRAVIGGAGLKIAFQPIFGLDRRQPIAYEALARFSAEPQRGPLGWFADAREVGLEVELELTAAKAAIAEFSMRMDSIDPGVLLSINASPETLLTDAFVTAVEGPVPADRLVMEITEHAEVEDYADLGRHTSPLRSRGMRLAIDDVGAGYANLRHILQLEPDFSKLDITLTRGIEEDERRQALAAAMVSFSERTDCQVIAEGIETAGELDTLVELGVPFGQGYYLAKPGPLA